MAFRAFKIKFFVTLEVLKPMKLLVGGELCPADERLLTQQGGGIVFKGNCTVFRHSDSGILKYVRLADVLAAVKPTAALPA